MGEVMMLQNIKKVAMLYDEDWFGEQALFHGGLIHHVTMRCETDCEFLVLSRSDFRQQVSLFPSVQIEYEMLITEFFPDNALTMNKAESIIASSVGNPSMGVGCRSDGARMS